MSSWPESVELGYLLRIEYVPMSASSARLFTGRVEHWRIAPSERFLRSPHRFLALKAFNRRLELKRGRKPRRRLNPPSPLAPRRCRMALLRVHGILTGFFFGQRVSENARSRIVRKDLKNDLPGAKHTSPRTFTHFGPQDSHWCTCYYHKDLH